MRQIVLDTETTGIGHELGHRIIEIGCVELEHRRLTGRHFHVYLNPERDIDEGALRVHGISREFLSDKPRFIDILEDLLAFINQAELIIHNAPFDVGFINSELVRVKHTQQIDQLCIIFDTLSYARKKHPGQRNNLDALCKRYDIDNSNRQLHGALLDAEILAHLYLAMTGGQGTLFNEEAGETHVIDTRNTKTWQLQSHSPVYVASAEELHAHQTFVEFVVKNSGVNLWEE